nr:hypothetical protein CFP56_50503 [Quercus suber]POF20066.1 hypothetical protein CFP56_52315 [Quercus suber]
MFSFFREMINRESLQGQPGHSYSLEITRGPDADLQENDASSMMVHSRSSCKLSWKQEQLACPASERRWYEQAILTSVLAGL